MGILQHHTTKGDREQIKRLIKQDVKGKSVTTH